MIFVEGSEQIMRQDEQKQKRSVCREVQKQVFEFRQNGFSCSFYCGFLCFLWLKIFAAGRYAFHFLRFMRSFAVEKILVETDGCSQSKIFYPSRFATS